MQAIQELFSSPLFWALATVFYVGGFFVGAIVLMPRRRAAAAFDWHSMTTAPTRDGAVVELLDVEGNHYIATFVIDSDVAPPHWETWLGDTLGGDEWVSLNVESAMLAGWRYPIG